MTDNEIIKALECCFVESNCAKCPYYAVKPLGEDCLKEAATKALDIIKRQTAEIEQLKRNFEQCANGYRRQIHLLQHKFDDEKMKIFADNEQLKRKCDLAVAEREANVKGFTEQLSRAKTAFAREIFAEFEKEYGNGNYLDEILRCKLLRFIENIKEKYI